MDNAGKVRVEATTVPAQRRGGMQFDRVTSTSSRKVFAVLMYDERLGRDRNLGEYATRREAEAAAEAYR